jgi:hypothetical protein
MNVGAALESGWHPLALRLLQYRQERSLEDWRFFAAVEPFSISYVGSKPLARPSLNRGAATLNRSLF